MLIMKILFLFALIRTTWGESFFEICENVKLGALELEKGNCMATTYYKNRSEILYQRYSELEPPKQQTLYNWRSEDETASRSSRRGCWTIRTQSESNEFCQPFWDYGACMPGETNNR
uniref:Putative secreted protein n=1 Tax=Ixodes ricinus TaxID=34613 RepID=A0A6B0ULM6_IXORI